MNPPRSSRSLLSLVLVAALVCAACDRPESATSVGKDGWLEGTTDEKLDSVAKHLRGNDLVMWEVEFRHQRLYEALTASNMDYARYQLEKIVLAMELGAERRPARQISYQAFFDQAVPPMQAAIDAGDPQPALLMFQAFTAHCVTCHATEKLDYMPVAHPWEPQQP